MKLYTINATWVRPTDTDQDKVHKALEYPGVVARILSKHGVDGFTIYEVQGYWKSEAEKSYKIEIAHDNIEDIRQVCEKLRNMYNEDAVMLTLPDNTVEFI